MEKPFLRSSFASLLASVFVPFLIRSIFFGVADSEQAESPCGPPTSRGRTDSEERGHSGSVGAPLVSVAAPPLRPQLSPLRPRRYYLCRLRSAESEVPGPGLGSHRAEAADASPADPEARGAPTRSGRGARGARPPWLPAPPRRPEGARRGARGWGGVLAGLCWEKACGGSWVR